ncbi:signal peptide protein [Acinetobacter baumannii]|nr:signal peptide protein [Acinetobacter baumannii]
MLKKLALAALLAAGSSVAMADNDVGCGVGTQVWAGQKGVVPKILAATTNGIFTNQLLGITFGTLGCRQGGTVTAQVVTFTNENAETLARDMAVGQGESLNVLAELMQIKQQDKDRFFKVSKANFGEIYSADNQNTLQVLASLQNVMAKDDVLKAYV